MSRWKGPFLFGQKPILASRANIELGDTGSLNVRAAPNGTLFTIMERDIERASVVLDRDRSLYIIRALCKLNGIPVKDNGVFK